jgi:hypothetical protein
MFPGWIYKGRHVKRKPGHAAFSSD